MDSNDFLNTYRSEKSPIPAKRIQNIIEFLTYEVFKYSCRGLYENHKFLFTLLLALKIDIQGGKVKVQEFQTLIKGNKRLIFVYRGSGWIKGALYNPLREITCFFSHGWRWLICFRIGSQKFKILS